MTKTFFKILYFFMWLILMFILLYIINKSKNIHPIMLNLILISYAIIMILIMSTWKMNFLYSLILFLIMISGMFIIFMYFSSTISNKQFLYKFNWLILIFMLMFIITLIYMNKKFSMEIIFINKFNEISSFNNSNETIFNNIMLIYKIPFYQISILCMIYLLFTLIIIIKICSINLKPLRKIN